MSTSTASSSITRPNPLADEDPIRDWMRIVPKSIPASKRPQDITEELRTSEFDPSVSRAIVFAMSRQDTEDLARELDQQATAEDGWKGRIRWFHAGMTADERSVAYESYRNGGTVILCATKAFGMGMDLPNIHHVFHHQPPFSLEDYIQEIGRAGRSDTARRKAGFGTERPIRCILYAESGDFDTLHGRLKNSRLSWGQLSLIQEVLHDYAERLDHYGADPDSAIPVPTNLLARHEAFQDEYKPSTLQRTGFHWLEQLERIRQEYYVPAHLELENKDPEPSRATTDSIRELCQHVEKVRRDTDADKERILVNTGVLFNILDVNTSAALFEYLQKAQAAGHVHVFRTLSVRCTRKRADVIREATVERTRLPPRLELAFHLVESILTALSYDRFFQVDTEWFRDEAQNAGHDILTPSSWTWIEDEETQEEVRSEVIYDLQQGSRARGILFLVRNGPDVQFRSNLDGGEEVFELRVDSREESRARQERYLQRQKDLARRTLALIYEKRVSGSRIDLIPTLEELDLEGEQDIEEFEQVLLFLARMGFIRMSGGLLPMAIETYLLSREPLDVADQEGEDFEIYERFQQSGRLKELRLLALRVLTALEERDAQNRFIQEYLRSQSAGDVFSLLDETLSETEADPQLLSALREEALKEEVERLSDEQRAVYEAPLNESTLVSAGPGSGKTHTLLLRLARLIHEENISPSQILVLAYNRAVVTEVKSRLRELLKTLGYRDLSRRLRVFTFHGLIRYALGDEVDTDDLTNEEGDKWVETFNRITENRPGRVGMHLSPDTIRYIFVDEFQDITEERYRMLSWIAGDSSRVTAIGDPDQSIYGYQRAKNNQARSAEPFFERFSRDFDATEYQITDNFRSLPKIVEHADHFIRHNENRKSRDALVPQRECPDEWAFSGRYVETNSHEQFAWLHRLNDLLQEEGPDGKRPRDVAVLFRSNAEVFRGYRLVQNELGEALRRNDIPVVVQGATRNWMRVREIAYCVDQLRALQLPNGDTATFPIEKPIWSTVIEPEERNLPSVWDDYTLRLIRCVIERFEDEQTDDFAVESLIEHIQETFRRDKGQIYKLLQIHEEESQDVGARTPSLVLSNLHKVKGLEYDVVVMPASFQPLPFSSRTDEEVPSEEIEDMIEEERRVYYVGMTRARDRLIRYEWRREINLRKGTPFDQKGSARHRLGVPLEADAFAGHVMISKSADEQFLRQKGGFDNGNEYLDYMRSHVQPGDPLTLVRRNGRWYVQHQESIIAQLAWKVSNRLKERAGSRRGDLQAEGVTVSDVVRYTYEDSLEYDQENDTNYTDRWSSVFREKGYTYIVNFAGFARLD